MRGFLRVVSSLEELESSCGVSCAGCRRIATKAEVSKIIRLAMKYLDVRGPRSKGDGKEK